MRITDPSQIPVSGEIFLVRVVIDDGSLRAGIHKLEVVYCPSVNNTTQLTVVYGTFQSNGTFFLAIDMIGKEWELLHAPAHPTGQFDLSMDDMGIIPNLNHMHQLFDNLIEAKQYAHAVLGIDDTNTLHDDYDRAMTVI